MGKIRVKSFGDQELEEKDKRRSAKRAEKKEQKKLKDAASGEDVEEVKGAPQEEQAKPQDQTEKLSEAKSASGGKPKKKQGKAKEGFRSANYKEKLSQVDRTREYSLNEALSLLTNVHMAKFDETVEIHVNTLTGGISGNVTLPHGSGKKTRVAIASDALISEIETGKISFDVLLSTPDMMPKLARVAKVLGPRGLMPNPKNGTITQNPQDLAKKFEEGLSNFKTEAKAPIIHMVVGKMSFGPEKLAENIATALGAIKKANITNVTLKSTMSPGIKIKL